MNLSWEATTEIERLCDDFESDLRQGRSVSIERLIRGTTGDTRRVILRDLLLLELEYRRDRGEAIVLAEYQRRFPADAKVVAQAFDHIAHDGSQSLLDGQLHIRCPNCHVPILVEGDTELSELCCVSCDTPFHLLGRADQNTSFQPSDTIGRFRLESLLGQGAFGDVWLAVDSELDRHVAIKVPRKEKLSKREFEQFAREAQAAARLKHPNIVGVHEVGRNADAFYIVCDYIDGPTLDEWQAHNTATARKAAALCRQIAGALQHAHEAGIVHRDLKPANIILDSRLQPHLMDFGLAKHDVANVTVTTEGEVLGTPAYMPPEQASGAAHQADARSDVYSLGVILFELLTGEKPFRGTVRVLLDKILHEDAPSTRAFNSSVPRDLDTICLKSLEKDPRRRYQTAKELSDELARFLQGHPIKARPISRSARVIRWSRRSPLAAGLLVALSSTLIALVVTLTVLYVGAEQRRRAAIAEQAIESEKFRQARALLADLETLTPELLGERGSDPIRRQRWQQLRATLDTSRAFYEDLAQGHPEDLSFRRDLARVHSHLADACNQLRELQLAAEYYNQAIGQYRIILTELPTVEDQMALARCLGLLAGLHADGKRLTEAESTYQEALDLYAVIEAHGNEEKKRRRAMALLQNNLGTLYAENKRRADAGRLFEQALTTRTQLVERYPDDGTLRIDLGVSSSNYAIFCSEGGQLDEAVTWHDRAIALLSESADGDFRDVHTQRRLLINAYRGRAITNKRLQRFPESIEDWQEALRWTESSSLATPHARSVILTEIGRIAVQAEEYEVALATFIKNREVCVGVASDDKVYNLAIATSHLGLVAACRRDFPAAVNWYTQALAELEPLLDNESLRGDLATEVPKRRREWEALIAKYDSMDGSSLSK